MPNLQWHRQGEDFKFRKGDSTKNFKIFFNNVLWKKILKFAADFKKFPK